MILNVCGFIGSGIWLLVIGQWRSVVAGILVCVIAKFVISLALLPSVALGAPGIYFAKRRITIGVYFFGLLSSIYTYVLITAWCAGVTFYFLTDAPAGAFWPLLIWAYGVATAPWTLGLSLSAAAEVFAVVMAIGVTTHMRMLAEAKRAGLLEE
jgi:hypothetical protein